MPINSDKPHLWKADVSQSIDYYNDWFLRFAPDVYREQRQTQAAIVKAELERSNYLRRINAEFLKDSPGSLQILRMATAPPLARDRLIGLAYVTPNLVNSMEGKTNIPSRLPPRMPPGQLRDELERICDVLIELIDIDIFTWLVTDEYPTEEEVKRAASVLADRLCGAISDPMTAAFSFYCFCVAILTPAISATKRQKVLIGYGNIAFRISRRYFYKMLICRLLLVIFRAH